MTKRKPSIAVIGAGIGGLAAAAILSRTHHVAVYERSGKPGGKIRQIIIDGNAIDSGPTVFTMPWVFEDIFEAAGSNLHRHVSLQKLDILARHAWRDGSQLDLYADKTRSAAAIAEFAGQADAENYLRFCDRAAEIYNILRDPFMRAAKPSLPGLIAKSSPLNLLKISPFTTMWSALSAQFNDPRLRQLFGRYATYCGSSPFQAPATLMLVAHVEQEGVWTLKGGMSAIATALADVARANGADIHYNSPVSRILTEGARANGVELNSGERLHADAVVYNGDPAALSASLLETQGARGVSSAQPEKRSQSALTWSMLAKTSGMRLAPHTVFFSDDYQAEFDAVFHKRITPQQPTTYLFAPDRAANTNPPDEERLFCLINAPHYDPSNSYSEEDIEECRQRTFNHLQTCGLKIETTPQQTIATTPADFAQMFPGSQGALYGMASHGWRASFQRPGVRTKIPGLYLTGGCVHPGPGVPMAALSGKAAATAIAADCASTSRSTGAATSGGMLTASVTTAPTE